MIDIHNHLLIGVDDGPRLESEAIDLLKQAQSNGISDIIVTPHHRSGGFYNPQSKILEEIERLNQLICNNNIDIRIHPGQEIRVNGEIVSELKSKISLSLNHSKYVLIELPFSEVPHYVNQLLFDLQMNGFIPVIAHPERCKPIEKNPDILTGFIERGAIAQVTANSIAGVLGKEIQQKSLKMLKSNLVHIIGSDAHHSKNRPFMLKEAYEVVRKEIGPTCVNLLKFNAEAILNNKEVKIKSPKQNLGVTQVKRKKCLGLF